MEPKRKALFPVIICLLLIFNGGVLNIKASAAKEGYDELVSLYESFRSFHLPEVTDGVPDYSSEGMQDKFRGLQQYQSRLANLDTTGWDRSSQVDYRIVEAEMRGMEFQHRVSRPWEKDPAFYAVIRFQFGPKMHPSLGIPSVPIPESNMDNVQLQLKAIPVILDQARDNLTDPIADLAYIAIYTTMQQMNRLESFIGEVREHHPKLVPTAQAAYDAIESYREWLIEARPNMRNGAGFGIENYNWYLKNVALMPYNWDDLLLLSEREYERAIVTMKLKEHRNRNTPVLKPVDTAEEYFERYNGAMDHMYLFMKSSELFTVPDYLNPPRHANRFSRSGERDYFEHVLDRYPMPLSFHGYAGHDFDALRTARDNRPIRGTNRLFFIDGVRAEAVATGLERMFHHLGVVEYVPRADELTYNLKALRAARSIADLKMHSNEMTFEEAFQFCIDNTPYGWVPEGSSTLWHDLELYLRLPLYGTSYLAGPVQLEKVITDAVRIKGDDFNMTEFMDEFFEAGMTPLSLISYEMLGLHHVGSTVVDGNDVLHNLMDEAEHFRIVENPLLADADGNYHEPDKLPSESLDDHERRYEFNKSLLARLIDKVDRETLNENNQVTYDLFRRGLEHSVKSHEFNIHLTPEFFYSGIAGMVKRGSMKTTEDFDNYIKRLEAVPQYFEQHIERLRRGLETGYTMPKVLLTSEDARRGVLYYIVEAAEESDFYEPLKEFPSSVGPADQKRLRDEGSKAIMEHVIASYRNYVNFLDDEYIPGARETIGLNDLPGGKEFYDHMVRYHTTLPVTAREVHETGLKEVERIRGEMEEIVDELGFKGDLNDFFEYLLNDDRFTVDDPAELIKVASHMAKTMDGKLPGLFHVSSLPKRPYGVEAIPEEAAPRSSAGYYNIGGGDRAGFLSINTYNLPSRPLFTLEALVYHEGVPGHHLEIALSQELENAPRKGGGISAYSEGWALYSERLGLDAGLYQDPYSNFGRLNMEMRRACRLVVDTGIHAFGWTRDEVVEYFRENMAITDYAANSAADRYIRNNGHALSYKMGEIKILELRKMAEERLGDEFDIRDFHEVVLGRGPVLLPTLEEQVYDYVDKVVAN